MTAPQRLAKDTREKLVLAALGRLSSNRAKLEPSECGAKDCSVWKIGQKWQVKVLPCSEGLETICKDCDLPVNSVLTRLDS